MVVVMVMRHIPVSGGPRTEPPVSVWPPVLLGAADSKDLPWPERQEGPNPSLQDLQPAGR